MKKKIKYTKRECGICNGTGTVFPENDDESCDCGCDGEDCTGCGACWGETCETCKGKGYIKEEKE